MRAELYWLRDTPHGRLAIMPRPRAGDWLADELKSMDSSDVDVVVSLLTHEEIAELGLQNEPALCGEIGLTFISYPIMDRNVPDSITEFLIFVDQIHDYLCDDRGVAIHCRMGIGRSSLVAACLLMKFDFSAENAFRSISRDRGIDVPDTNDQIEWVNSIAGRLRG